VAGLVEHAQIVIKLAKELMQSWQCISKSTLVNYLQNLLFDLVVEAGKISLD
jgi:hypothetical protein